MSTHDYIPSADDKFNVWQKSLTYYADSNRHLWNIPNEGWNGLIVLRDDWELKFETANNLQTRTSGAVFAKNTARNSYESALRKFIKAYMQYNPVVTDNDRHNMGLPVHSSSHTPVPAPTTYPEAEIDSSIIRRLTIRFHDAGATGKAKPHGVHGAEIRWGILGAAPEDIKELVNSEFDTHTPFTLEFEEHERGKTVYFCIRWESTRGDKGPWGEIMSGIVP